MLPSLPWWNYIFLWCILLRQHDMAKVVFQKVEKPTAMALIAYQLCHSTKRLAKWKDKNLEARMEQDMVEWSRLATGTLDEYLRSPLEEGRDLASELLLTNIPFWDNATCLELAIESQNLAFVESPVCQYTLDIIWMGSSSKISSLQFAIYLLFPFLVIFNGGLEFFDIPMTKFAYNVMMYVAFLIIYAYVILFGLARNVSTIEYALMTWVFSMLVEEIRQVATATDKTKHIKSGWNAIDFISIFLFFIGFGLRFKNFPDEFDAPRVVLSLAFVAFVLRLIHIFSLQKVLGPKLIMIKKMFQDLLYFLLILAVFFVSYAISSHSILYPNSPATWETARQILRRPYWHLYGELFLDETEGLMDCTNNATMWTNGTYQRCPSETGKMIVPIMMGVYLLFANILLVNLLIALFSYTFNKIHVMSDSLWCFQRYFLIKEYAIRPLVCPPLNCLLHMYQLLKRIRCKPRGIHDRFRLEMLPESRRKIHKREKEAVRTFMKSQTTPETETMSSKIIKDNQTMVDLGHNKYVLDEDIVEELRRSMAAHQTKMAFLNDELRSLIRDEFKLIHQSFDALSRKVAKLETKVEDNYIKSQRR
ncbi:transient receptor potential cation channel subfamily M member 3-like [Dreissena polymorpha]|uniref:transient receptor potential cation channel subfamily M member 3-like n=1 Tax=Dreissena polymorpha TaxID=45954 RepID=UPI002264E134|nr:transient receptor potential cation channel subfamily M member 3-like [Dreissena polymorpha]